MLTDIEIAQSCVMQPIEKIADTLGLTPDLLEHYGRYKAKVDYLALKDRPQKGRLVLVTAINPTPAGEGINLHFTGDMHAITAANNLIAAMVDNSIQQGNPCNIDPRRVTWKRCMDMNDRQLRNILDGLGGKPNGTPREDGFDITTASEIMATLCLASSIADLKARIARIVVARTYDDKPPEPRANAHRHARVRSRRPVRQHRARLQHGDRHADGAPSGRRCGDGGGLRRRPRRGKIHRYQVPHGESRAQRGRARGDGSRAQEPRRRGQSRPRHGEPRSAGTRICAAICATSARSGVCIRWSRSTALRPIPTRKSSWCAVRRRKPARKSRSARFGRRAARAAVSWPGW